MGSQSLLASSTGSVWAEAPSSVLVSTETSQPLVLWASAPAAAALLLPSVAVCLLSFQTFLSLSAFDTTLSFYLWKKELLLYREMDLTVWRKQVTSHHYIH